MLVKCLRKPLRRDRADGWDREIAAFERLPRGLFTGDMSRAPRFLGAERPTLNTARLWLEYVDGRPAASWSTREWQLMSAGLAALQAGYVSDAPLLSEPWLNHDDLRQWLTLDRARLFPIRLTKAICKAVEPYLDPETLTTVAAVWRGRNKLLDRLDTLPQTLCHNDIWSGNVLLERVRGGRATLRPVILDWQLAGPGPVGSDLVFAVVAGVWLALFPGGRIEKLERALITGYAAGLRKAGKSPLMAHAAESFAVTAALRYGLMLPQLLADVVEPGRMSEVIERGGGSPVGLLASRARLIHAGARWARACGIA